MLTNELRPGVTVWAPLGSNGWRPATVIRLVHSVKRPGTVEVEFETKSRGKGKRLAISLRPRNPANLGGDKPKREEAKEASSHFYKASK